MVTSQPVRSVNVSHILQRSTDRPDSECDHDSWQHDACTSKPHLFSIFGYFGCGVTFDVFLFRRMMETASRNRTGDLTLVAGEAQADVLA